MWVQCHTIRYGYLDTVDHGPEFIQDLIAAVVHVLADGAGLQPAPAAPNALE